MDEKNNPVLKTLLGFLEQPEKCDVKFNVHLGGDAWMPFWGHKLILSIWSPVLATYFSEKENDEPLLEIDIEGYPPTVFKHFLKFMYGSSEGIFENKNNGKFLLDLYKLAKLYQVEQLKKDCRKILIAATVDCENVFQFLNAANYIDLETVKFRCFELIRDKTAEVIAAQDLKKTTSSMVFTVLELDTLSLSSEYDLLSWVFDWAESERNKLEQENPQELIKPFLPYLNFATLTADQFAILVNKHKEFFDNNDGFRIFLNICNPGPDCMPLPSWHREARNFRSYKKLDCEESNTILSENLSSNDTQNDSKPEELGNSVDKMAGEPTEDLKELRENAPTEFVNSKSDTSADNSNSEVDKSLFKNTKPQECHTRDDVMDSLTSLEQVAISLSESSLLDQDPTHQFEDELENHYSLNEYGTDSSQTVIDYSKLRRKIKKKKVKKWYMLPGGKSEPHKKSMGSMEDASGDFQSLIGMVWKQNRLGSV